MLVPPFIFIITCKITFKVVLITFWKSFRKASFESNLLKNRKTYREQVLMIAIIYFFFILFLLLFNKWGSNMHNFTIKYRFHWKVRCHLYWCSQNGKQKTPKASLKGCLESSINPKNYRKSIGKCHLYEFNLEFCMIFKTAHVITKW